MFDGDLNKRMNTPFKHNAFFKKREKTDPYKTKSMPVQTPRKLQRKCVTFEATFAHQTNCHRLFQFYKNIKSTYPKSQVEYASNLLVICNFIGVTSKWLIVAIICRIFLMLDIVK